MKKKIFLFTMMMILCMLIFVVTLFAKGGTEAEDQTVTTVAKDWNSSNPTKTWTIADKMEYAGIPSDAAFYGENLKYLDYDPSDFIDLEGKLVFSSSGLGHPFRQAQAQIPADFIKQMAPKVEFVVLDAKWDANVQINQIRTALVGQPSVLGIVPHTETELAPISAQAMKQGIPVVTWDRRVDTEVTIHVGPTDEWSSRDACRLIADLLDGKGNIIEIQGTAGATPTIRRHDFFLDEKKKYPELKIVASQVCDYLREPAMRFMEDALVRFGPGEIDAIYAHNDEMALGAIAAIEAAGRLNEGMIIIGMDGQNEAVDAVANGTMTATYVYHYTSPEAIIAMLKLLKGETLPEEIVLPSARIDKKTADKFKGLGF